MYNEGRTQDFPKVGLTPYLDFLKRSLEKVFFVYFYTIQIKLVFNKSDLSMEILFQFDFTDGFKKKVKDN